MAKNHALSNHHSITPLTNQELITSILLSAKNALVHADDFKEKFVSSPVIPQPNLIWRSLPSIKQPLSRECSTGLTPHHPRRPRRPF
jgi:hypothetical protein